MGLRDGEFDGELVQDIFLGFLPSEDANRERIARMTCMACLHSLAGTASCSRKCKDNEAFTPAIPGPEGVGKMISLVGLILSEEAERLRVQQSEQFLDHDVRYCCHGV